MIEMNKTILHNGISAAEGKLICGDVGSFGKMMDLEELRGKLRPIIISETEHPGKELLFKINGQYIIGMFDDFMGSQIEETYKILAYPENFSQEQLKMIINGELKNGDSVIIECGKIWHYPANEPDGGEWIYQVKLDEQKHINILTDRKENWEKFLMRNGYTPQDIIKITNDIINYYEYAKQENNESWDDIRDKYGDAKTTQTFERWLQVNYNPPTKK